MSPRFFPALLLAFMFIGGCATTHSDNIGTYNYVSDRLFFGRNIPSGGTVSDSAWSAFLAEVVTPRFPDGLTVWRAEGQWLNSRGRIDREETIVLEVLHPFNAPADSVLENIATIYRTRFKQEAVLRTTGPIRMQLYEASRQ